MRKFYNLLLIIVFIGIIVVSVSLIIKYRGNYKNEQEIEEKVASILKREKIDEEYKGYKIIGIIQIPKIDIEYPILENTTDEAMKISITKAWGNRINETGNLGLAGHNNYDGTMFGKTKNLIVGDTFKLIDVEKNTVEYKIYEIIMVKPDDTSVVKAEKPGTKEVTLITCNKGNKERRIIKAREI